MAEFLAEPMYSYGAIIRSLFFPLISEQPLLCEASGDRPSVWHKALCRGGRCSRCICEMLALGLEVMECLDYQSQESLCVCALILVPNTRAQEEQWAQNSISFFSSIFSNLDICFSEVTFSLGDEKLLLTSVIHVFFSWTFTNKQNSK